MPSVLQQREALLRLLADDDTATVALVKAQLAGGGLAALAELHALHDTARGGARDQVREVIAQIEEQEADGIFAQLCAKFGEAGDLEEAAWRLAATFFPAEDFSGARALLDEWGAEVSRRLPEALDAGERVEILTEYLTDEVHLRGNEIEYHEIDNSLLPRVIARRCGIPITLALVHMLVARRAGMRVEGIGLPGHFLARHEDVFFDPFHGGHRIGLEECRALLQRQNLVLAPHHLAPATAPQILIRMLTNIYTIAEQTDPPLAAKVGGWVEKLRVES